MSCCRFFFSEQEREALEEEVTSIMDVLRRPMPSPIVLKRVCFRDIPRQSSSSDQVGWTRAKAGLRSPHLWFAVYAFDRVAVAHLLPTDH